MNSAALWIASFLVYNLCMIAGFLLYLGTSQADFPFRRIQQNGRVVSLSVQLLSACQGSGAVCYEGFAVLQYDNITCEGNFDTNIRSFTNEEAAWQGLNASQWQVGGNATFGLSISNTDPESCCMGSNAGCSSVLVSYILAFILGGVMGGNWVVGGLLASYDRF